MNNILDQIKNGQFADPAQPLKKRLADFHRVDVRYRQVHNALADQPGFQHHPVLVHAQGQTGLLPERDHKRDQQPPEHQVPEVMPPGWLHFQQEVFRIFKHLPPPDRNSFSDYRK